MTDFTGFVHGVFLSGRPWGTSLHLTSANDLGTVAASWATAITNMWDDATNGVRKLLPTTTVLDTTEVVQLDANLRYFQRSAPSTLTIAGTDANIGTADEVAMVISKRAAVLGKGTIGPMRLPAPAEDQLIDGQLKPAAAQANGIIATALLAELNAGGITVFIFNRKKTLHSPTPLTKKTIAAMLGSEKLGSVAERPEKTRAIYH